MPDVAIRTATVEDLPQLRRVYREAALSNPGEAPALLARPELLEFAGSAVALGHTRVAALASRQDAQTLHPGIVGFTTLIPGSAGDLELEDLFVDPAWQRRGIARQLIEDAVRRAGHRSIMVTGNSHALAFYQALGFVPVGHARTTLGPAPRLRRDPAG